MKKICIPLLCVLSLLIGCEGENPELNHSERVYSYGLRVEETEGRTPDGGVLRSRTTYRGDDKIMYELWQDERQTRIFYIDGRPIGGEADETGDGHIDKIEIWAPDRSVWEVFHRDRSGEVTPLSDEDLNEYRAKSEAGLEAERQFAEDVRRAMDAAQENPER